MHPPSPALLHAPHIAACSPQLHVSQSREVIEKQLQADGREHAEHVGEMRSPMTSHMPDDVPVDIIKGSTLVRAWVRRSEWVPWADTGEAGIRWALGLALLRALDLPTTSMATRIELCPTGDEPRPQDWAGLTRFAELGGVCRVRALARAA